MRDRSQHRRLRSLVTLLAAALALFTAPPAGARPVLLAGVDGRVQTVPEDLSNVSSSTHILVGGTSVVALAPAPTATLALGANGDAQLLEVDGMPAGAPFPALPLSQGAAAAWGASEWLVGGQGGHVRRVAADGVVVGGEIPALTVEISEILWVGDGWIVLGGGELRRLGPYGVPLGPATTVAPSVTAAAWSGKLVLIAQPGFLQPWSKDGAPLGPAVPLPAGMTVQGVAWGDPAFLVVGSDGTSLLVDEAGAALTAPVSSDASWRSVAGNDFGYLAAGGDGATRAFSWDGSPEGPVLTALEGATVLAVAPFGKGWLLGGELGSVQRADAQGVPVSHYRFITGMALIGDASWNGKNWLIGSSKSVMLLDVLGDAVTGPVLIKKDGTLPGRTMGWNGTHWLYASDYLFSRIDGAGAVSGSFGDLPYNYTYNEIVGGGWNGDHWLVCTLRGYCCIIDANGKITWFYSPPTSVPSVRDVTSVGRSWLVLREAGVVHLVGPDGKLGPLVSTGIAGSSYGLGRSGTHVLAAGQGGQVRLLSLSGEVVGPIHVVLSGHTIRDLDWTGKEWIVAGDEGYVQRLKPDGTPVSPALQTFGSQTVYAVSYGGPNRGPGEPCHVAGQCTSGACLGGVCRVDCLIDGVPAVAGDRDPENDCRRCDPGTSVTSWTPLAAGVACDDGDACTVGDVCGGGGCMAGPAPACDDGSPCTLDWCAGGACVHVDTGGQGCNGAVLVGGEGGIGVVVERGQPVPPYPIQAALGGQDALAIAWSGTGALVGGAGGAVQRVGPDGVAVSAVQTALGGKTVRGAAWGGAGWLVGGDEGPVQRVDASGQVLGAPVTALGGETVHGVAFDGEAWLVVGAKGKAQRVDASGAAVGSPLDLLAGKDIRGVACRPGACLVVGGWGLVQLLFPDGTASALGGTLFGYDAHGVAWDGLRFVVVGNVGYTQVVGQDGVPVPGTARKIVDVLYGIAPGDAGWLAIGGTGRSVLLEPTGEAAGETSRTVIGASAVAFTGTHWLVVGAGGLVQRVEQDGAPPAPFFAAPGGGTVRAAGWRGDAWRLAAGTETFGVSRAGEPDPDQLALDGAEPVTGLAWSGEGWLAAGGAEIVLLDALGERTSTSALAEPWSSQALAWRPGAYLLAGTDGAVVLDPLGAVTGPSFAALGGQAVRAASAGASGWLLAGDLGRAQLVTDGGATLGPVSDVLSGQTVYALAWDGARWLAGGAGGLVRLVGPDGQGSGEAMVALGGATVRAIAWTGDSWVVGGEGGLLQELSPDGAPLEPPAAILGGWTILSLSAAGATLAPGEGCTTDAQCSSALCADSGCACEDGCTIGGACIAALSPHPSNPCLRCDPASSPLAWTPLADGSACADASPCGGPLTCRAGACDGAAGCDDGDPCTTGACDLDAGACVAIPADGPCDDGDPCTQGDACAGGACLGGAPAGCDDGNPCTADTCAPGVGCAFVAIAARCDDGNPCTGPGACVAGACAMGAPLLDGGPCGSAAPCFAQGTCSAGLCVPGAPTSGCAALLAGGDHGSYRVIDSTLSGVHWATSYVAEGHTILSISPGPSPSYVLAENSPRAWWITNDFSFGTQNGNLPKWQNLRAVGRGAKGWLAVGGDGKTCTLVPIGSTGSIPETFTTISNVSNLRALSWNGSGFLAGGAAGAVVRVSEAGGAQSAPATALSGGDVRAIAWSGAEWLVGGDGGLVQRVSSAGATVGGVQVALGGETIEALAWTGQEYVAAGAGGWLQRVGADGVPMPGTLQQVGGGWFGAAASPDGVLLGGEGGLVLYLGADGEMRPPFTALDGATVRAVAWSIDQFIVGGDGGRAQMVTGAELDVPPHRTANGGFRIATASWDGKSYLVGGAAHHQLLDAAGAPKTPWTFASPTLGGGDLLTAAAGPSGWLVGGSGGRRALVSAAGVAGPVTVTGGAWTAASWSGATWLLGGASGVVQRVDAAGQLVGPAQAILGGRNVRAISWGGQHWLVAADNGFMQRVSPSGELVGGTIYGKCALGVRSAAWSGEAWLVGDDCGTVQVVGADGVAQKAGSAVLAKQPIDAIAWTGDGWLVGGALGRVRRLNPDGTPADWIRTALDGEDVRTFAVAGSTSIACTDDGACPSGPCVDGVCVVAPPLPPEGLAAWSQPGGLVALTWEPPLAGPDAVGYSVYRSAGPFAGVDGMTPVAQTLELAFTDAAPDGTWFYGVTAWIDPTSQSAPVVVAGVADGTAPVATIAAGSTAGPGVRRVLLTSSEPLAATPTLALKVGGQLLTVPLTPDPKALAQYRGNLMVIPSTPTGRGTFSWSGVDLVGNAGSAVVSGATLSIDTLPPTASITTLPSSPLGAGPVAVALTASELLSGAPHLSLTLPGGAVVKVNLAGKGAAWAGSLAVPAGTPDGAATFAFAGKDVVGNLGTVLTRGGTLVVDTEPPAPPSNVTATPAAASWVRVAWSAPTGEVLAGFDVYRSAAPIASVAGLQPVASVVGRRFDDQAPTGTWHYAVTSVDLAGNASAPASAPPVVIGAPAAPQGPAQQGPPPPPSLRATVDDGAVALEWEASAGAASYRISRDGALLTETDGLEADGGSVPEPPARVLYEVSAVDAAGQQGPPRAVKGHPITLTVLEAGWPAPGGWELTRGFFDQVIMQAHSDDAEDLDTGPLTLRLLDGETLWEGPAAAGATIPAGGGVTLEGAVFTPATAPGVVEMAARLVVPGAPGSEAIYLATLPVEVRWPPDAGLTVTASGLTPGGTAAVQLALTNHGSAPMDVVTAAAGSPSPDVSVALLDGGSQLSTASLLQTSAPAALSPIGHFVRVAPAATWLPAPIPLPVPAGAPSLLTLAAHVAKAWHLLPDPEALTGPALEALAPVTLDP